VPRQRNAGEATIGRAGRGETRQGAVMLDIMEKMSIILMSLSNFVSTAFFVGRNQFHSVSGTKVPVCAFDLNAAKAVQQD
jgi:hypothetical protein